VDVDEPRRNDVFDRELRRALAAEGGATAGPHVDAELAAAWMDRQLDPVATRSIEAHVAGCQECQILMATLARLAPADAPAPEGLAWWRRLRAGWLVPATVATAAALVIWVAVPQQRAASTPADQLQARADRSVETPPPSAQPLPPPVPSAAQEAAPAPAPEPQAKLSRRAAQQGPQEANELEKKEADLSAAPPSLERRERFADAASPAVAPPPAAPAAAPTTAPPPQESITVTGESPARANARQDAASESQRSLAGAAGGAVADGRLQSALVIAAPDGARWRRTEAALEFAPRGGAFTATTMPVAAGAINAGAAPGGTVCWLAGNGGVVLISTDGVRFTRVTAPVTANLIAIAAADARSAVVTTADGRRFRTTDRGASWSALP
jgi:putative zinc finger protein